ncbi:aspartate aminotransferase family protein [Candidatus Poribacteria bacterium]|jgi:4-aminobutyrate aminotransferase-like enzyme|nr:aspartate aminotransferase family protein [Candidatus Poribacteria bacterium]MBT5712691.1 aspartate aminotransferase family protein [Candidatus Poribacteria bacterium]MBT7099985.1 aspartate aminotransferase family protein [Candidatus Poribacteria bacterium]MBT7806782.1 aspartate aminotransferase family protein [Candidatus Poribacteria bacterium]
MSDLTAIRRDGEPRANATRDALHRLVPRGHKTYTPTQLVVRRATGCRLEAVDGARLLDFSSGVLVANLGHAHPEFEARYAELTQGAPRNCYNAVSPLEPEAAERLIASLDRPQLERVMWADSGSAGIIKAIWAAQHARPDKRIIIATRAGFHGKKGLAGDVTGETSPNPNVRFISFPTTEVDDISLLPDAESRASELAAPYIAELDALTAEHGNDLLTLVTEPYLGAAGSFHPPKWYLRLLSDWCAENGVVFVLDEVQSCHGRTGEMYAYERYGIEPDIVVLGKGLGNGAPIAATVGRAELLDSMEYGEASDTYSGNPHGCAAVTAALDVYESQPIVANCRAMSQRMQEGLSSLRDEFACVANVRGEGLVWGVEMAAVGDASADEVATAAVLACYHEGVHLLGPLAKKVLRVSPPLVVTADEVDEGIDGMRRALRTIA